MRRRSGYGSAAGRVGAAAVLLLASSAGSPLLAQFAVGETYWDPHAYVEYIVGNAPIVISSAHGGYLEPSGIPDRTYGVLLNDRFTQEMTRDFAREIREQTGRHPHVIIGHLHRSKLDVNRAIGEAAQGNPVGEAAYGAFHDFIEAANDAVTSEWGRGLYFDMHGHAHPEDWTELGYGLTASALSHPNATLDTPSSIALSTLQVGALLPGNVFTDLLRGPTSLGGFLEARGWRCVPSPMNSGPRAAPYFNGGYNVRSHSSLRAGSIDGIQVELPFSVRGSRAARSAYAADLAQAAILLLSTFYGIEPGADPRINVWAEDAIGQETGDPASFTLTRTGSLAHPRTVPFHVQGRATPGSDYTPLPASVTFPAGSSRVTLVVDPWDDAIAEGWETVTLQLVGGTELGSATRASVLIIDDEPDPTLEAHWSFDALAGAIVPDASGEGRAGTLWPAVGAGPRSPERGWRSLLFDEIDDHILVPDWSYSPKGAATLSLWFRASPSASGLYQYLFAHGGFGTPQSVNVYLDESSGRLRIKLVHRNALVSEVLLESEGSVMDGEWHHMALVSRAPDLAALYVDGEECAVAHFAGDALNPAGMIFLGARNDLSPTRYFGGQLDDVRLYGRALDGVEARTLRILGRARTPPRLTELR